ncbi:PH domain-containing protein [Paenibacillus sp. J2TS4]|uniref:PH domain-containing protein n=1 Tax=Paenibacillus sp. J2TS4 TaxID=2807194 RepID=UPI001B008439|nr:PH domain-containing protein [Paenibacillus sp. J2TS4]GIP34718.1 membrane protein [Paenibacillus sp. J2TS4]
MTKAKRYHPLTLLLDLWKLIRNSIVFALFLFVIKAGSDSHFITFGRIIFLLVIGISLISILLKWFTHKYELDDRSFHLYKGIINKSEQTIPFSKVQNVNRHTSLFHQIFKMTSIHFETGMAGEEATVEFKVIPPTEADRMEALIANANREERTDIQAGHDIKPAPSKAGATNRIIHFEPTKKDILKASFTSLSFLVLIPLMGSVYFKINEVFHIEEKAVGMFRSILSSWWMVTIIILILGMASTAFGIARTYIKYGKYQISTDPERIYITKGVVDETAFSISKDRVQAVEITQSLLKRWLGLAEVKLTSAGSSGENSLEINSLYPFLPVRRAYELVSEILPAYKVTQKMMHLPTKSLGLRLLRPSWIWIIATAVLFYFKPALLKVEQAWWILSAALLILVAAARLLDFFNTRYILNDHFIQFKTGSLATSLFVSKRDKVIEVHVTRSLFQKRLGLASIETINRAKPVHHAGVTDVPLEFAESFYTWYMRRRNEIKVE